MFKFAMDRWERNKAIDIWQWSVCGGDRLERFYCTCIYVYIYMYMYVDRWMGPTSNGIFGILSIFSLHNPITVIGLWS